MKSIAVKILSNSYLEGLLKDEIDPIESTWVLLTESKHTPQMIITLEKKRNIWWEYGDIIFFLILNNIYDKII
jgi:hypothetical protein